MDTRTKKYKNLSDDISKELKHQKVAKKKKKRRKLIITLIIIILISLGYMHFIEPYLLCTKEYNVKSDKISSVNHGFKLIQISDLHYGTTVDNKYLKRITKEITRIDPDIIVFTGDLVEESYEITEKDEVYLTKFLENLPVKYGKYAIKGNHDFYNKKYESLIKDSGFILLNNTYDIIYTKDIPFVVYGVDDIIYGKPTLSGLDEIKLDSSYKIVLLHEPDYIDNFIYDYNVDLVLAGHSHNKQVNIPFINAFWLPEQGKKYYEPYYRLNETDIYVSNGIGTSKVEFRLNSLPSINLYRIVKP